MMRDKLINNFLKISSIPRMSGNEKQIADFFVGVAQKNKLYYFKDENNNVLIKKKGNIEGETIAFQSHLDMVCVKRDGSNHNFDIDGIDVVINGDEVKAKDTSLGADQGVGLALMLALIEDNSIKHPDLEFLFTVEEETTFNGAINFPYDKVTSKKMINLDYCRDDAIVVGSAGDIVNEYIYNCNITKKDLLSYKLSLSGLSGGNSGEDLEESKNNAIITIAKTLLGKKVYIKSINGGTFENDVATSCEVILQTDLDIINELKDSNIKVEKIDNDLSFSLEDTNNIINEIIGLESGQLTKTASGNLGIIKTCDDKVIITYLFRSTNQDELQEISNNIKNFNNNFIINNLYVDRIWNLSKDSLLYNIYKKVYYNLYKTYPSEDVTQAGLEIASIQKRIEGLDIISIGANMKSFHTVDEVTYISSWEKVYNILINILCYDFSNI